MKNIKHCKIEKKNNSKKIKKKKFDRFGKYDNIQNRNDNINLFICTVSTSNFFFDFLTFFFSLFSP